LPEAVPAATQLPDGSKQGVTSSRSHGYHALVRPVERKVLFKVYALDTMLDLPDSSNKQDLLEAMKVIFSPKAH